MLHGRQKTTPGRAKDQHSATYLASDLGNEMGYVESTAQLSGPKASVSNIDLGASAHRDSMLAAAAPTIAPQDTDERTLVAHAPEARESSYAALAIVGVLLLAVWGVFTVVQRLSHFARRRDSASVRV